MTNFLLVRFVAVKKQENLSEYKRISLQFLTKEFIYKHKFHNLAMTLLMNITEVILMNILMMKKHQAKLKQT